MGCREHGRLTRRHLLAGGAASLTLWGLLLRSAAAADTDSRLLVVILRGGLDGLALAQPMGDPDLVRLRGPLAMPREGDGTGLPLDGFFVLNPAMPYLHTLYQKREALVAHAVATPYRERSHFDGQDVLESGYPAVGRADSGWLNRAVAELGAAGKANPRGLAMGAVVPLIMRGPAPVLSWSPQTSNLPLRESTIARLADLYTHTDPALAEALAEGQDIDRLMVQNAAVVAPGGPQDQAKRAGGPLREFVVTAETAARFLAADDGPRIGALSYNGWDTHANEGALKGQLATRLGGLDLALKTFAQGMGSAWKETVVIVVTEFGRTARINGTEGTDHGTGTVALTLGGRINGGRVLADWPGLSEASLHEGRDLRPTLDLRALLKGVLRDHLGVADRALASVVFPDSASIRAQDGIIAV
jgi:uncharacterized protein (DUF1501 family)